MINLQVNSPRESNHNLYDHDFSQKDLISAYMVYQAISAYFEARHKEIIDEGVKSITDQASLLVHKSFVEKYFHFDPNLMIQAKRDEIVKESETTITDEQLLKTSLDQIFENEIPLLCVFKE